MVRETVVLESVYKVLPESMHVWIQDKTRVDAVHKATELAGWCSLRS